MPFNTWCWFIYPAMDRFIIQQSDRAVNITDNVFGPDDAPAKISVYENAIPDSNELCRRLMQLPDWKRRPILVRRRPCMQNRMTCFYADDTELNYKYSGIENTRCEPFPVDVRHIKATVEKLTGVAYNYCLMNLYETGAQTIGWHSDKEGTLEPNSPIASVSLGAARFFDLRRRDRRPLDSSEGKNKLRLDLKSGTLVVMWSGTQSVMEHQVPAQLTIKEPRVNLTFRVVKRSKTKAKPPIPVALEEQRPPANPDDGSDDVLSRGRDRQRRRNEQANQYHETTGWIH